MHERAGCALDKVSFFLLDALDGIKVVRSGDGTSEFRKLYLHAFSGEKIDVIVQRFWNGIPSNEIPAISRFGHHVGWRCRKLLFRHRISGAPFVGIALCI